MEDEILPSNSPVLRILDAAGNRAREALHVLEDYARFSLNEESLTAQLKELRHDLASVLSMLPMNQAMLVRDTPGDVGTTIKTTSELHRSSLRDVLTANAKRLSESLRSLEECAKTMAPAAAAQLEQLRYRGYALELSLMRYAGTLASVERFRRVRLYVLMTAELCRPCSDSGLSRDWEQVLDEILDSLLTAGTESAGSLCIQLREKRLDDGELLRRARHLVLACRQAGTLSIINDRPDIALLAGADGVHAGQSDLPCGEVRRLLGPDSIIGISTENLDQARLAAADGATYIAVGPMFHTTTKHKPRIAGPEYAAQALAVIDRPLVAIGGITLNNVGQLMTLGVGRVAVSSSILQAPKPGEAVRSFLEALSIQPPRQ